MKVSIAKIRPNPFQVRKHFDTAAIKALANEIKVVGFWSPLRAREVDGHYELCFGHRRLEALKYLEWKNVDVDVVKVSDDDMAIQALVENLQREGLTDVEKGEAIQRMITRLTKDGLVDKSRLQALIGLSESRISALLQTQNLSSRTKKRVVKKEISGQAAILAELIGGEEMAETAAKHRISQHGLTHIKRELDAIEDKTIRDRVKKDVVAGKVVTPEAVKKQARKVARQAEARSGKRPPPDLLVVIRSWTKTMIAWAKKLDEVQPYLNYIESEPETANEFKAATRDLIDKLKRFL